jgi:hypothetical protein
MRRPFATAAECSLGSGRHFDVQRETWFGVSARRRSVSVYVTFGIDSGKRRSVEHLGCRQRFGNVRHLPRTVREGRGQKDKKCRRRAEHGTGQRGAGASPGFAGFRGSCRGRHVGSPMTGRVRCSAASMRAASDDSDSTTVLPRRRPTKRYGRRRLFDSLVQPVQEKLRMQTVISREPSASAVAATPAGTPFDRRGYGDC